MFKILFFSGFSGIWESWLQWSADAIRHTDSLIATEVILLHSLLSRLDGLREEGMLDGFPFFHAELLHDPLYPLGPEDAQQVVLKGKVKA